MISLPKRISLAQRNTPLQLLSRLSTELGGPRIWVKRDDMTGCGVSGNKVRKLEFTLAKALDEGCDTLITSGGVQSNHCRATALLGAQLGLKVRLILRGEPEVLDGNLLLDHLAGAEISHYSPKEYFARLPELFAEWEEHYRKRGRKALSIPTGGSDGVGLWGYIGCAQELAEDFKQAGISPTAVICATGSGGTQAGLTVGIADAVDPALPVLGMAVSDDADYFQNKVRADIDDWQQLYGAADPAWLSSLSIHTNDDYIGPGYGKATQPVFDLIAKVARTEGLLLDPVYTGKAFYGLIQQIKKGQFKAGEDIVFIHTGGIFGLFAQRQHLKL